MKDVGRNLFVIIGKQGVGKSTFGKAFAKARGTEFHETSEWLVECETLRQKAMKDRYDFENTITVKVPQTDWHAVKDGWDEERNRPARELLVALGDAVNTIDSTFLHDRCFEKGDICAGTRRKSEFEALFEKYGERLNVFYLSGREGPQVDVDNFELTLDWIRGLMPDRVFVIENNGTVEELEAKAKDAAEEMSFLEGLG